MKKILIVLFLFICLSSFGKTYEIMFINGSKISIDACYYEKWDSCIFTTCINYRFFDCNDNNIFESRGGKVMYIKELEEY